jgi:hypothetical protein
MLAYLYTRKEKGKKEKKAFNGGEYDSDQSDSKMMKNKKNNLNGCFCVLKFRFDKL